MSFAFACVLAHNPALTLHYDVLVAAREFRRQRNFKLHMRTDIQVGVATDVNSGGTHVAGCAAFVEPLDLDRQFQRKSFSSSRFGHKPSFTLAVQASKCQSAGRNQRIAATFGCAIRASPGSSMTLGGYTTECLSGKSSGYSLGNAGEVAQEAVRDTRNPKLPVCYPRGTMPGFNGLRVLSFESRRAKEIAQLISQNSGVPTVAPSTRDVPEEPDGETSLLIRGIIAGNISAIIFMTGVGARALIEAGANASSREQFLAALGKTRIVVRGPKPAAVMREFGLPVALTVPEPNTWAEIVRVLDANAPQFPLRGSRIAVQEHGEPSPELYAALRERSAEVLPVHVYRWALPEDVGPLKSAIQSLIKHEIDVVLFTASVQFTHAERIAQEMGMQQKFVEALQRVVVASIGPTTTQTLREHGVSVDFEPSHPRMGILVAEAAEKSPELIKGKSGNA